MKTENRKASYRRVVTAEVQGKSVIQSAELLQNNGVQPALENSPAVLPTDGTAGHRWVVVLAGGDGTRLQSLTLKIAGDHRPKQFCSFFGGETLLTQTRARLESLFHVDRELFVVTRSHETYYREELRNVDESRIIPQPLNRGTGVAAAVALVHILQRDPDAVVVLVPCDHYYSNDEAFGRAIRSVISGVEQYPDAVILLGAEARYAEIEYGWIEVGSAISDTPVPLFRVNRFWEKPSMLQAQDLLRRGCLWNTFVTAGRASTFLDVLCTAIPNVVLAINNALADNELEAAYRVMPAVDLSRQVFAPQPHRLLMVRDVTSGWADLGSPSRVMEILARNNIHPAWLREEYKLLPHTDSYQYRASQDGARRDVPPPTISAEKSRNNDRQKRSI
jgi:mannose-1-phosphate guanylyltransferase